ncbi:MAG: GNAT family N-acetyltransferase [Bifidobacteriaceae bacterium]|nr:GNAT family N-acetyltransferase [Bifidobacteriaceae bacterium]
MAPLIRPITATDGASEFDCGQSDLNTYLRVRAWPNHRDGAARCFVATQDGHVIGYYALAAGQVERNLMPGRVRRNMPDPLPAIVLARLAIDLQWQGKGLGAGLLKDALQRAQSASQIIGARVLIVHAIDEAAQSFYNHFDFSPFPGEPLALFIPLWQAGSRGGRGA